MNHPFFNAHHAPVGAFATLTLGYKGAKGGLGIGLAGPANENFYVGVEDREGGRYRALPFFEAGAGDQAEDYDVEHLSGFSKQAALYPFADEEITRTLCASIDEWQAGDLTFRIISPVIPVPDPETADAAAMAKATLPAIYAELTVDNRDGAHPRKAFFGYQGSDRTCGMRIVREEGWVGIAQGTLTGIASDSSGVYAGIAFQPEKVLEPDCDENLHFLVGNTGLLVGIVPAGEIRTFRFSIGFYHEGTATTGIRTRYAYTAHYEDLEHVLDVALQRLDEAKAGATRFDRELRERTSEDRAWMLAHAIRSYYGSTQLLERDNGRLLWVVNEGEYRMMNTFDLTVDHAFFELSMNPWAVRNVLDLFVERYAYQDQVRRPGDPSEYPGGLSFTHDMGVANAFARHGYSGYEQGGLKGCFSYMTAEELMNWILTAGLYVNHTEDKAWAESQRSVFIATLASLVNRDAPSSEDRTGVVGLDAARCRGGSEITTYDSLDASLGQARNNTYLAVKGWASYLTLAKVLRTLGETDSAELAEAQARRAVETILSAVDAEGLLPAVIGEGVEARIIPAIEALVYPYVQGIEMDARLTACLKRHFEAVLRPGLCLFPDGGWKLSSTSRNSWLSKIYLCQFVAERVLGETPDPAADTAHRAWLLDPENACFAWSDQMLAGKAVGSRYYPRGVTGILWTASGEETLRSTSAWLTQSRFSPVSA